MASVRHSCRTVKPSFMQSSCVTKVDTLQLGQHWKIENFASVIKLALPGNCLRSSTFRDATLPEVCWQLCLYPGGKRLENANHVSLFLKMSSTSPVKEVQMRVEYRFYFLNDKDLPLFSNVNIGEFHAKPPKGGHSWGLRNIPKQKVMNCIRNDGSLVISCHIELIHDINHAKCYNCQELGRVRMRSISNDFVQRQLEAFERGSMADCTLECCGQLIPVNKFVLTTHSKVFKAMFSHDDVLESTENRVLLADSDPESVRSMLRYMYTGELDSNANAEGVLLLAERYQIDELKQLCEQKLCAQLDKNNFGDILYLTDLYNCTALRSAIIDMIRSDKAYIMASPAWQMMKETNPRLIADIMETAMFGAHSESPPPKRQRYRNFVAEPSTDDSN